MQVSKFLTTKKMCTFYKDGKAVKASVKPRGYKQHILMSNTESCKDKNFTSKKNLLSSRRTQWRVRQKGHKVVNKISLYTVQAARRAYVVVRTMLNESFINMSTKRV